MVDCSNEHISMTGKRRSARTLDLITADLLSQDVFQRSFVVARA